MRYAWTPGAATILSAFTTALMVLFLCGAAGADIVPPDWESDYQGTALEMGDMDRPEKADIGFRFAFYDRTYNKVRIAANGYIGLGPNPVYNSNWSPEVWPTDEWHSDIISAIWADFNPDDLSSVKTYHRTLGEAGSRRFVVTWEDTPGPDGESLNTFQMQLHEAGNRIQLSYLSLDSETIEPMYTPAGVNQGDGVQHVSFDYDGLDNGIGPAGSLAGDTLWLDYDSESGDYTLTADEVPEPGTTALLLGGMVFMALLIRQRARDNRATSTSS